MLRAGAAALISPYRLRSWMGLLKVTELSADLCSKTCLM
jgi:hypothetical protein